MGHNQSPKPWHFMLLLGKKTFRLVNLQSLSAWNYLKWCEHTSLGGKFLVLQTGFDLELCCLNHCLGVSMTVFRWSNPRALWHKTAGNLMCVSVMSVCVCVRVSECVCVCVCLCDLCECCVCERRQEAGGRRKRKKEKEVECGADTELKRKTPHVNVGNKHLLNHKTLDMAYVN